MKYSMIQPNRDKFLSPEDSFQSPKSTAACPSFLQKPRKNSQTSSSFCHPRSTGTTTKHLTDFLRPEKTCKQKLSQQLSSFQSSKGRCSSKSSCNSLRGSSIVSSHTNSKSINEEHRTIPTIQIRVKEVDLIDKIEKTDDKKKMSISYMNSAEPREVHSALKPKQNILNKAEITPKVIPNTNSCKYLPGWRPPKPRKTINKPDIKKSDLSEYTFVKKIGSGASAEVQLVRHRKLGMLLAMKVMNKKKIKEEGREDLVLRQIKIHLQTKHENIVTLYDVFSDETNIYLVMEYMPEGNVYERWREEGEFSEKKTAEIIADVCKAVQKLHRSSIIHRDLKLQNILRMGNVTKIADMGCAIQSLFMRKTIVGTPNYYSPEQLNSYYYNNKVDIWSIGVMTYEMLLGHSPFARNIQKILMNDESCSLPPLKIDEQDHISDHAKDFLRQTLEQDSLTRLTIEEALRHPFLQAVLNKQSSGPFP